MLENFGIANVGHRLKLLDGFLVRDTNEFLFQGTRPEGAVEMEESLVKINP